LVAARQGKLFKLEQSFEESQITRIDCVKMASVGLLVPLVAKESQTKAVVDFLHTGYTIVPSEPLTREWFAVSYEGSNPPTYAIFDTFAADEGRQAHLTGKIAQALMESAEKLLAVGPEPAIVSGHVNVLASVVRPVGGGGDTAGVSKGLRVLFEAKQDKVDAVREFLKGSVPLVKAEPETPYWYAIEFPGTNKFGIVDFFPGEEGRGAHVSGKVAAALFGSADELLTATPDLVKLEVLAAKV
jgi:quinol monooxygenase YgiN